MLVFADSKYGYVTLKHTPERVAELRQALEHYIDADKLTPVEAASLRGRLHWFSSYLFGRRAWCHQGDGV